MSISFAQIVIDCDNAAGLATFWSAVLGHPVDPGANPYFATAAILGLALDGIEQNAVLPAETRAADPGARGSASSLPSPSNTNQSSSLAPLSTRSESPGGSRTTSRASSEPVSGATTPSR